MDYHINLTYCDSLLHAGEDILGSFKEGEKIALSRVLMLMITTSDNIASLRSQILAESRTAINEVMANNGLKYTRINSRTIGRTEDWKKYRRGQTFTKEMATLLVLIINGKMISPAVSECIYRNLIRI